MTDDLQLIIRDATQVISQARRLADLEQLRSSLIGKKSTLSAYLRELAQLPASERPIRGQAVNEAKQQIEALLRAQSELLKAEDLSEKLGHETVDVGLAGRGYSLGSLHPVTRTRERIENFFTRVGFSVEDGPEIEDDYHNFEALNLPSNHPARALHDTFYFPDGLLLRTHTSTVQIRAMERGEVPLKMIAIGRVYRRDLDITHAPMFHQLEGLVVNETANFSELKGILSEFLQKFFEKDDLTIRFRPAYFPFTEPSAEVDIQCVLCSGCGCRVCKQTGYLEILGCGMVHPQVLERVGVSPEKYQGYAFGLGIDRLAMLRYGIPDIRLLFENDCRFLEQF